MIIILFVVGIMLFSGIALSSVVADLAVRPLERMLGTVRHIASTVFKFSEDGTREDGATEIEGTSEMVLLEKVVERLANIASLQSAAREAETAVPEEDMAHEDIGILKMMHGRPMTTHDDSDTHEHGSASVIRRKNLVCLSINLEVLGLARDYYESFGFNTLDLKEGLRCPVACYAIARFHESGEGFVRSKQDESVLQRFMQAASDGYMPQPFHNFCHAVDVVHEVTRVMRLMECDDFLTELQQFALLVSAVGHDLGHPGMNNGFLLEVSHDLALQYNDKSPLENMHCARLYSILQDPEANVLRSLTKDQYGEVRAICIDAILHTDMINHQPMVKDLQMAYQMNSEIFNRERPQDSWPRSSYSSNLGGRASLTTEAERNVFNQPEVKTLIMEAILHSADVSNPCRTWDVTQRWSHICIDEFFAQGDEEKKRGIPVQFLNNRETLSRPNSQIGFIEFMVAPLFVAQIRLWPKLLEYGTNLANNIGCWERLYFDEASLPEEEQQKVSARVLKVRESLENAACRSSHTSHVPSN